MTSTNGLPRLGSPDAKESKLKTEVVAIPDRGVSIVLRKPSVGMILEMQDQLNPDSDDIREGYSGTVALVARMLVEPEWDAEALKTEVDDWSFQDWQVLQNAALKLAGLREEDVLSAQQEFRGEG